MDDSEKLKDKLSEEEEEILKEAIRAEKEWLDKN